MKRSGALSFCVGSLALSLMSVMAEPGASGAISGRISPNDASVRVVAKLSGTDYRIPENIKGEVTLPQGGDFTITNLPPGKYDLLFFLQGESKKRYMATRWSEIRVAESNTTSGIHYRLTPKGSPHLIDEVLVVFEETPDAVSRRILREADCIVKDRPLNMGKTTLCTVDIPDDRSVAEMVRLFNGKKGVKYAEPNGIATIQGGSD